MIDTSKTGPAGSLTGIVLPTLSWPRGPPELIVKTYYEVHAHECVMLGTFLCIPLLWITFSSGLHGRGRENCRTHSGPTTKRSPNPDMFCTRSAFTGRPLRKALIYHIPLLIASLPCCLVVLKLYLMLWFVLCCLYAKLCLYKNAFTIKNKNSLRKKKWSHQDWVWWIHNTKWKSPVS